MLAIAMGVIASIHVAYGFSYEAYQSHVRPQQWPLMNSGGRDRDCRVLPQWAASVMITSTMGYSRITTNPDQMAGTPCIRGLRIPVATVLQMLAEGIGTKEILDAYPDLEPDDISESLRYAAAAVRERELPLKTVA